MSDEKDKPTLPGGDDVEGTKTYLEMIQVAAINGDPAAELFIPVLIQQRLTNGTLAPLRSTLEEWKNQISVIVGNITALQEQLLAGQISLEDALEQAAPYLEERKKFDPIFPGLIFPDPIFPDINQTPEK